MLLPTPACVSTAIAGALGLHREARSLEAAARLEKMAAARRAARTAAILVIPVGGEHAV